MIGSHHRHQLEASLVRTLRRGVPDHMVVQRYDVPDRGSSGRFVTKVWVPVNAPVMDGDDVVGLLHRVDEVTALDRDVLAALTRATWRPRWSTRRPTVAGACWR